MKDFEDVLLDINRDNLNSVSKKHNDIDNKAIGLITVSGVLISLLLGFIDTDKVYNCYSIVLLYITAFSFLYTVYLSILVLKPLETYTPSTLNFINDFWNETPVNQIRGILNTSAVIEDELQNVCDAKALKLTKSVKFLGYSVIILTVYALSTFL